MSIKGKKKKKKAIEILTWKKLYQFPDAHDKLKSNRKQYFFLNQIKINKFLFRRDQSMSCPKKYAPNNIFDRKLPSFLLKSTFAKSVC